MDVSALLLAYVTCYPTGGTTISCSGSVKDALLYPTFDEMQCYALILNPRGDFPQQADLQSCPQRSALTLLFS